MCQLCQQDTIDVQLLVCSQRFAQCLGHLLGTDIINSPFVHCWISPGSADYDEEDGFQGTSACVRGSGAVSLCLG